MVKVIRDRISGKVQAVMDEAAANTDGGGGFGPIREADQEMVEWGGTEDEFWKEARRSANGSPEQTWLYDDGSVEATNAPEAAEPGSAVAETLRLLDEERGERAADEPLTFEDVSRAVRRVEGGSSE